MNKIKVLVADSSEIYALGIARSLSESEDIQIFNHAYTSRQVIDTVQKSKPDIVIIGPDLLNQDEAIICENIRDLHSEVKVMVLISPENLKPLLNTIISTGVTGILPRNINPNELVESVIEMAKLGATIHPTVMPQILTMLQKGQEERPAIEILLSTREREVIELLAEGGSNREIANTLFISENTVKSHLKRICSKLNTDNRVDLARHVLLNK